MMDGQPAACDPNMHLHDFPQVVQSLAGHQHPTCNFIVWIIAVVGGTRLHNLTVGDHRVGAGAQTPCQLLTESGHRSTRRLLQAMQSRQQESLSSNSELHVPWATPIMRHSIPPRAFMYRKLQQALQGDCFALQMPRHRHVGGTLC